MEYRIGTRGSKLALVQAEYVRGRLQAAYPQDCFGLEIIKTKGDVVTDRPLGEIGGSGLFVREIERALLSGKIQLAVHSMKDMPCRLPEGLAFAPVWGREDPRDVLVLREEKELSALPPHAVIGTGSRRRALQLLKLRPDLRIVDIRGNVETRLKKMHQQGLDGIVLAAAGLKRLGMEDQITCYLSLEEMIPAPAQGTLAIEVRSEDRELLEKLSVFEDQAAAAATRAERTFLQEMGADCHLPVGAYAFSEKYGEISNKDLILYAIYGNTSGEKLESVKVTGQNPEKLAKSAARAIRSKIAGKVVLLGAGPGNTKLLTVAGQDALKNAQCVIFDRLASKKLLALVPETCEQIYVGKENHNHTMPQEQINRLLVQKAMEYGLVVRLKGGDSYVFGRGGEEALYLREYGIPFEVIPGVSSALAGPACAGIPVTHRGVASGFHVVTAHNKEDRLSDIDFEAMAAGTDTCVFLMGLGEADLIARRLIEAGRSADTPAAVISHATTEEQRCCEGTLGDIAQKAADMGMDSPALIVVGEVVSLREKLNFFEEKPGFGQKYLVAQTIGLTRESTLAEMLERTGAGVDTAVCGRLEPIPVKLGKEELSASEWIIFSSRNGVHAFFWNLYENGMDARALGNAKIAAIGKATQDALAQYGILSDWHPRSADSESFCREFALQLKKDTRVLYPQNEATYHPIAQGLLAACRVEGLPVYRNVPPEQGSLPSEEELLSYDRIYFTNAAGIRRLLGGCTQDTLHKIDERNMVYVIGPACARALQELGITRIHQAAEASYEALARLP